MHCTDVLRAQQELLHLGKVCVISCVVAWFFFSLLLVFEDRIRFYSPGSSYVAQACLKLSPTPVSECWCFRLPHLDWKCLLKKKKISILDKIDLIKQYLTVIVIMCSENLEGNKREKKKITFLHTKKKVFLHRVGVEECFHFSPRLFRTVVEC